MSDIKMSECCTCGTKWRTGQDGRHSCSSKLSKDNHALVEQNSALRAALSKIAGIRASCTSLVMEYPIAKKIADKALEQAK